jgi:hypothetical protein
LTAGDASGALRLDVQETLKPTTVRWSTPPTNGIIQHSAESAEKLNKGELLLTRDIPYFSTAPTFETSSEKCTWLNDVELVNKMVELKLGEDGYGKYDVYILRQ